MPDWAATATIAKGMVDLMPGDTVKGRPRPRNGDARVRWGVPKSEVVALNVEDLESAQAPGSVFTHLDHMARSQTRNA
jgi:hypothetical protein